ncbi:glycine zipper 2TM domain-containing protein [Accumulibacter sp.]|uniref:glycine zipper 2TM domain-containing protein n=1 Tax=Accumulibacter sp. TaxID=2053492 RepID=UPI002610B502|nr:glycine zipper 2TM domain-containing protein [Accumulibacter sp.]
MKLPLVVALVLSGSVLVGCADSRSGSVYSRDQARQELLVRQGIVESVREVALEGSKSGTGIVAGAAVGGVAGSNIGGGKGQIVGAILGAVAGGLAGAAIEEGATRKIGLEITVRLESGQLVAVVQEGDERFLPGERVRLLSGRGDTRVTH